MSPHDEEDYELVLGNRQLFFLAVVLFGVFFSIGYTVGYSRGHDTPAAGGAGSGQVASAEAPSAPTVAPLEDRGLLAAKSTETVYSAEADSGAPKAGPGSAVTASAASHGEVAASRHETDVSGHEPEAPAASAKANPGAADRDSSTSGSAKTAASKPTTLAHNSVPPAASNPAPNGAPAGKTTVSSGPVSRSAASSRPRSSATESSGSESSGVGSAHKPAAAAAGASAANSGTASPAESASSTATVAVPDIEAGSLYLQVLASRDAEPARKALYKFKAKGYPVALDNRDPDWYRILVGPFHNREDADAYQARLKDEGIKPFLRQF